MYQTPFADRIRNEVGIATMAVGAIFEADHVNSIIAAGRADLCALARPHLADPVLDAARGRAARLPRHAVAAAISRRPRRSSSATSSAPRSCSERDAEANELTQRSRADMRVVTGGGRGIGAAIAAGARRRRGAASPLMGRDAATRSRPRPTKLGGATCWRRPSRSTWPSPTSVQRAFARAAQQFGPAAILVNNAGQAASAPFQKTDVALWQRMLDVNLTGTFLCTQAALAGMLHAGYGRIVNIASIAGLAGAAYVAAYCAAKHGVIGLDARARAGIRDARTSR